MFGICNLSVIPCRKEPADKSEIVTQLLFGDCFEVLDTKGNWTKIKTAYDSYEGWIDSKQFITISETNYKKYSKEEVFYTTDLIHPIVVKETDQIIPILIGSTLHDFSKGECEIGKIIYTYDGHAVKPNRKKRSDILETAFLFLNAPYLWGGKSPFGIDCSGLIQTVYKLNNIHLLRDANQQATQGETLSFIDEAQPGDLAFFDNDKGKIVHVGIVLPDNKIIHASGKVRIDKLDHHGIFNEETKKYSHNLRVIKNVFD